MKKIILLFWCLIHTTLSSAQALGPVMNRGFQDVNLACLSGTTSGFGAGWGAFIDGCVSSWTEGASPNSVSALPNDGYGNYYAELNNYVPYSNNFYNGNSSIITNVQFIAGTSYTLTFRAKSNGYSGGLIIKLLNGSSGSQQVYSSAITNTNWQTYTLSFTANNDYSILSFGSLLLGTASVYAVDIDDIQIPMPPSGCCTASYIVYTNSTPVIPYFTGVANYIRALTAVNIETGNSAYFQAGEYIQLEPGFETKSNSNFMAYIQSCTSSSNCHYNARIGYIENKNTIGYSSSSLTLYPNPTNDVAYIQTGKYSGSTGTIEVTNLMGEKVLTIVDNALIQQSYEIQSSNLQGMGMYLLKITDSNNANSETVKFIVSQ